MEDMETTSCLLTGQHNSLLQHTVALHNSRGINQTQVKEVERKVGCRSAHLYATV